MLPAFASLTSEQLKSHFCLTIESHFCPTHVGDYSIDMRWSGEHIIGSTFTLTVTDREEEEGVAVGGASDCCCAHGDENFQEGVTFF